MKKIALSMLLLAISFSSMGQQNFTLKVQLKNVKGSFTPYIMYTKDGKMIVDSNSVLANGAYIFKGSVDKPVLAYLMTRDPSQGIKSKRGYIPAPWLTFFLTNEVITIKGDADKSYAARVAGGKINNDWNVIKPQIAQLTDQDWQAKKIAYDLALKGDSTEFKKYLILRNVIGEKQDKLEADFIEKYPQSLVSMMMLSGKVNGLSLEKLELAYNKLDNSVKQNIWAQSISAKIAGLKATAVGQQSIAFTKTDMNGKALNLADLKGKYVLLDFWGSWCGPCRASHPHLKKLYQTYKDRGFEIVGIAQEQGGTLEESKKKWLDAINEDGIDWVQILNNDGIEKSDLVKNYGVSAFPTKILLDKDGKILARYVGDNEQIDAKLAQLIK